MFHHKFEKEVWVLEHNDAKPMRHKKRSFKRSWQQCNLTSGNKKKILNNLTLHLKQLEKEEKIKPKKLVEEKKS